MLFNPNWKSDTKVSPTARILLDSADHFEKIGWCQGQIKDDNGRMCTIGAIYNYSSISSHQNPAIKALLNQVGSHGGQVGSLAALIAWNNTKGRTKEEVITAFRAAAATV